MTLANEIAPIRIDPLSSEPGKPHGIITVDCSSPYEYDDGIAVTQLPSTKEAYQVHVFAADTSSLYIDEEITKQVIFATESKYYEDPRTAEKQYEPMLDRATILNRHFESGKLRNALVVSFVVGAAMPPQDVQISFGQVEVQRNLNYKQFAKECIDNRESRRYNQAAAFIMKHLNPASKGEPAIYKTLFQKPQYATWKRGSNINQAYMIAANHLVGQQLAEEGSLAIYRNHDSKSDTFSEIIGPRIAMYSTIPGFHEGLGLSNYCRVTSPLRRAEDFVMHGLLRARDKGRPIGTRDLKMAAGTVQRLNQRTISSIFNGDLRLQEDDLWAQRPQYPQIVRN